MRAWKNSKGWVNILLIFNLLFLFLFLIVLFLIIGQNNVSYRFILHNRVCNLRWGQVIDLRHPLQNGLKWVVVVLPYLSNQESYLDLFLIIFLKLVKIDILTFIFILTLLFSFLGVLWLLILLLLLFFLSLLKSFLLAFGELLVFDHCCYEILVNKYIKTKLKKSPSFNLAFQMNNFALKIFTIWILSYLIIHLIQTLPVCFSFFRLAPKYFKLSTIFNFVSSVSLIISVSSSLSCWHFLTFTSISCFLSFNIYSSSAILYESF